MTIKPGNRQTDRKLNCVAAWPGESLQKIDPLSSALKQVACAEAGRTNRRLKVKAPSAAAIMIATAASSQLACSLPWITKLGPAISDEAEISKPITGIAPVIRVNALARTERLTSI
jgi:hypothetical protein